MSSLLKCIYMKIPAWLWLIIAIFTEVIGTLAMNSSGDSSSPWMYILMYIFICMSYISLSFALTVLPVGIAIAIWEGLGLTLITCLSYFFLGESLTLIKFIGLLFAISGIILVTFGEAKSALPEKS